MRRYAGSELGQNYRKVLGWAASDPGDLSPADRTLSDLLDPSRPGRPTDVVNAVTQAMGQDVAAWRWERVLSMAATLADVPQVQG